jgi:DNA-directed RNA polymerase specialized sigma24 family protein
MFDSMDLESLTLAGVAHHCAQETERFFQRQQHDPRYCFELFRRAIIDRSQRAWELVYRQYRPLVAGWVERHSAFASSGEEVQYFVNRAFEKMWSALPAEKFDRFPNLKSLLRYLQMCVHSVIVDQVRNTEQVVLSPEPQMLAADGPDAVPGVEREALTGLEQQVFWQEISMRLNTDQERRIVYGSFILGLKPRQLYAHYPEIFRDVQEIYRVKENVLARLRRDDELKELLRSDA